jgi:integrase
MSGTGKTRDRVILTDTAIKALKPAGKPYRVVDLRAAGLAIRVAPGGLKSFDVAYRLGKTVKRAAIGRYGDLDLEQARERANKLTSAARLGRDLIADEAAAREAASRRMNIGKLLELYLARRVIGRLRSVDDVVRTLRRVLEPLGSLPAADVRRRDLAPLLEEIAAAGHLRAAGYARQLLRAMFRWARVQDIVDLDPTEGLPVYDLGTPRNRILDADELRLVWPWLETLAPAVADTLRVQLLTGARIGEISGMPASEIDRDKWLWRLPAERAKNEQARVTPLIGLARTIIETRIEASEDGVLFPSATGAALTTGGVDSALYYRRKRLPIAVFKTHDLRRTVASTMYAELNISRDVIGLLVGHSGDDDKNARTLIRHYLPTDLIKRKTAALKDWDAHLRAIISVQVPVDNIVPLRA